MRKACLSILLLLALTLPVMAVCACMIAGEDGSPVIFRQQRVTKGGRVYAAGREDKIIEEVSSWTGISAVCACDGYCIGLKEDGTLVFAGKFTYGYVEPKND